jgi:hypothetical protein
MGRFSMPEQERKAQAQRAYGEDLKRQIDVKKSRRDRNPRNSPKTKSNPRVQGRSRTKSLSYSKEQYRQDLLQQISDKTTTKTLRKRQSDFENDYSFFNSMGEGQP